MIHDQSDPALWGETLAPAPHAQAPPLQAPPGDVLFVDARLAAAEAPRPRRNLPEGGVRMSTESRRRIGRNLQLLYGDILSQPLPARFEALLADLSAPNETGGSR